MDTSRFLLRRYTAARQAVTIAAPGYSRADSERRVILGTASGCAGALATGFLLAVLSGTPISVLPLMPAILTPVLGFLWYDAITVSAERHRPTERTRAAFPRPVPEPSPPPIPGVRPYEETEWGQYIDCDLYGSAGPRCHPRPRLT